MTETMSGTIELVDRINEVRADCAELQLKCENLEKIVGNIAQRLESMMQENNAKK